MRDACSWSECGGGPGTRCRRDTIATETHRAPRPRPHGLLDRRRTAACRQRCRRRVSIRVSTSFDASSSTTSTTSSRSRSSCCARNAWRAEEERLMRIRGCSVVRTAMAVAGTLLLATAALAQPRLLTVAESSTFTTTSRHEDVMTFVRELQRGPAAPARRDTRHKRRGAADPDAGDRRSRAGLARRSAARRARGGVLPGQHPRGRGRGQGSFADAGPRTRARATDHYLDRLVVLIAPIFNPDGNDRISTANRPTRRARPGASASASTARTSISIATA